MAPAHAIDGPDAHDHATKQLAPELTIDGPQQDGYSQRLRQPTATARRTHSRALPGHCRRHHRQSPGDSAAAGSAGRTVRRQHQPAHGQHARRHGR
ncbi:hypothetical protein CXR27_14295 [Brevibacterium aurantiacum]|uniref:Uncharacterized protein n=1 Tax=Brevibacterium aurantiacum TaxID=273384 RepID=A0A3Q9P2J8_BREAU|nr:hypothetical protein CXR27_14295 [Brevibacterium aurantiacum]